MTHKLSITNKITKSERAYFKSKGIIIKFLSKDKTCWNFSVKTTQSYKMQIKENNILESVRLSFNLFDINAISSKSRMQPLPVARTIASYFLTEKLDYTHKMCADLLNLSRSNVTVGLIKLKEYLSINTEYSSYINEKIKEIEKLLKLM